ncbi:MAG: hypothetical protein HUU17_07735 [Chthonomonadales bacterium]|nr:hypothetical protein [Chthonomonadales bacterium]
MSRRRLLPLCVTILLAAGLGALFKMRDSRSPTRTADHQDTRTPTDAAILGPAIVPDAAMIGRISTVSGQARIIANLSSTAGPYLVSIRQIFAADRVRNLLDPPLARSGDTGPIGPWQLVLQVNTIGKSAGAFTIDMDQLHMVDDRGSRLHRLNPPLTIGQSLPISGGRSFTAFYSAPEPSATLISRLDGTVRETSVDGRFRDYPFVIVNAPLPTRERYYGGVRVLTLDDTISRQLPRDGGILVGSSIAGAMRGSQTDASILELPYLRLTLPKGAAASLSALLPAGRPRCTLMATGEPGDNIRVSVVIGSRRWQAHVWEREPMLLVMPENGPLSRRAFLVQLGYRDQASLLPSARPIYPATGKQPAGSIVLTMTVKDRPLGPGLLQVHIGRHQGQGWGPMRSVTVPVRSNSEAIIANIAPGRYLLELSMDTFRPLGTSPPLPMDLYLRRRYGVQSGDWSNIHQEVTVYGGRRTYGAPVALEHFHPADQAR